MGNLLLTAAMIAANVATSGMTLEGQGIVVPCIGEDVAPSVRHTCFRVGDERWGIEDDTVERAAGSTVKVIFYLDKVETNDGDTFRLSIKNIE